MPKHTHRPTDLRAPGAVEQLLAFHRGVFGDARMEADGADSGSGSDGAGTGAGDANGASAGQQTQAGQNGAQQDASGSDWDGKVESLPPAAQKMIRDLRAESADRRTKLTAAEQAQQDAIRALAKAAGIDLPGGEQAPKPDELAAQLTASQEAQRTAAVELAVYRTAAQHGGDPAALTDSRSFLAKVAGLDPTAEDFTTKVIDAAKAAVTENRSLAAARAAGSSSADHAGGSGEGSTNAMKAAPGQARIAAAYAENGS